MYFGCRTRRNVAAYICYAVTLATAVALILSWFFVSRDCGTDVKTCMEGLTVQPFQQGVVINYDSLRFDSAAVCEGLVTGPDQVAYCVTCVDEAKTCFWPTLPMLIIALVLFALSTFPCCFCLCCSKRPDEDHSQFIPGSAGKPAHGPNGQPAYSSQPQHRPPPASSYTGNNVYRV
jgi:hypothetical protein